MERPVPAKEPSTSTSIVSSLHFNDLSGTTSQDAVTLINHSFDYDVATGFWTSQITTVGTTNPEYKSIAGGFGAFECATGTENNYLSEDGNTIVKEMKICGACGNVIGDVTGNILVTDDADADIDSQPTP